MERPEFKEGMTIPEFVKLHIEYIKYHTIESMKKKTPEELRKNLLSDPGYTLEILGKLHVTCLEGEAYEACQVIQEIIREKEQQK